MDKPCERPVQITTFKAKPQFREAFAARAEQEGESISSFIRKAIEARMTTPIPSRSNTDKAA
jgi:hypothetical protein